MKISEYNFYFPVSENEILAYNSYRNCLLVIDHSLYNDLVNKRFEKIDGDVLHELYQGGFMLYKDVSEIDLVKIRFSKIQYSTTNYSLTIAPTIECNMNCKYCFESLNDKIIDKSVMERSVLQKLTEYVDEYLKKEARTFHVTWYGGEPLLYPYIIEELSENFVKSCRDNGVKYTASIITNGTLLTRENAKMLSKWYVRQAQVTIDGPELMHNSRRPYTDGRGTFKDIFYNVKEAVSNLLISLRVNVDKNNLDDMNIFLQKLTEETWYDQNRIFIHYGLVRKATDSCKCHETDTLEAAVYQKESLELNNYLMEKGSPMNFFPKLGTGCVASSLNNYVIGPGGELYKCWNHLGDCTKIVGTIFEKNNNLSKLNLRYLSTRFENDEECLQCKLLPICMGGCVDLRIRWQEGKNKSKHCALWKYNLKKTLVNFYNWHQKNQF